MSNNNSWYSWFPPAGNNNNTNNNTNKNNNKKKRKERTYLPSPENFHRQKKRRNAPPLMMAPPAQPGFGFGNPQMANPAVYVPQHATPFAAMSSTALMPHYPQFQAQFLPQAQYPQQLPQYALQPGGYQPGVNMQPMPGFPNTGLAVGQQPMTPVQAPAQAHPQGQEPLTCANCHRGGHLVGDCVGPPNQIHGDLPACPNCDSFAGGLKSTISPSGHRFDDCHTVLAVLYRLGREKGRRLAYQDLAALTNEELLMFFRALVTRRLRKAPIRTELVCWIDVLRETARRFRNTNFIASLDHQTPWTKAFAIQQHNLGALQVKPWEFYDYAAGNTYLLPEGPVEQVQIAWEDLVANGLPQFPAQVHVSSDRQQPSRMGTAAPGPGVPQVQQPPQTGIANWGTPNPFVQQPPQTGTGNLGTPNLFLQHPRQTGTAASAFAVPPVQQPPQTSTGNLGKPNPFLQQPRQTGTAASNTAVQPARSFGDDVPRPRVPPLFSGLYGNSVFGGSMFKRNSNVCAPKSSSRPNPAPVVAETPSTTSSAAQIGAGASPATLPPPSLATGTSTSVASQDARQSDHAAFMAMTSQGSQSTQLSATAPGANQNNTFVAPGALLPPSTATTSVAPGTLESAASIALPTPDEYDGLIDYSDEEE